MKKILFLCFIFYVMIQSTFSNDFEFTPININFVGVEAKGNIIAAYGDYGSMLISYDKGNSWEQKRIFKTGKIEKIFLYDDNFIAFSNTGKISVSEDKGNNWKIAADLNDSVFCVIDYPGGYFIRSYKKLFTISKNFVIINDFPLEYYLFKIYNTQKYHYSLAYFKGNLIAEIAYSKFPPTTSVMLT